MRKVTQEVVGAFMRQEKRKIGNTESTGGSLWLHGNCIARHGGIPFEGVDGLAMRKPRGSF